MEERYHYIVEQASDIILLYDLDTRCLLEGNPAFYRLLGYSVEDIRGLSIYDIVAHDRGSIDLNIENTKENNRHFIGPRKYKKKDGSLLDVEVSVSLFFIEDRGILCSIARDITERKLAEEALRKSEQEKTAILDGLRNASVEYLDPHMNIIWMNNAVQKHLCLSWEEIKGKRCYEVIQGIKSPCMGCTALKALQTGKSQEGELVTPDGKVWISHSNITKDADGAIAGVVHVAVNISDRKRAERIIQESENRYKAIFENTGAATVIVENNNIISLANSGFEKLSGYSRDEIEGKKSWTEFVIAADLEKMVEQHKTRRISPDIALRSYEFRFKNRSGNVRIVLLNVDIIPETKRSVASLLDITDRKQMEEALRESNEKYAILAESTQDCIYVIDRNDRIIYINGIAAKAIGLKAEKIIGMPRASFFPIEISNHHKLHLDRVFESGLTDHDEDMVIIGEREFWQDTCLTPIKNDDNEVYAVLGVSRDITDRKHFELELKKAKENAEAATRAKSEFLANMSHEIRTPMNAVIGLTELLLRTDLNMEQRNYVETIKISGDSLLLIINDILDFSKIDGSKIELEVQPFSLRECVEDSLNLATVEASKKCLNLSYTIDSNVPSTVIGDSARLRQIIINLANNAVKFTEKGGVNVAVSCRKLEEDDYEIHFRVMDTGIGIPEEKFCRLFQPFSQVDTSTTRKYGGTGLGLIISKRLVEVMGGKIWAESEVNRGSIFHFTILTSATNLKSISSKAIAHQHQPNLESNQMPALRILVAEDNPVNQMVVLQMLKKIGYDADLASNGIEVLQALENQHYDVVLMDVQMPKMDGLETAKRISQLGDKPRIIAMTAYALRSDMDKCLNAGMDDYMSKPVKLEELRKKLFKY